MRQAFGQLPWSLCPYQAVSLERLFYHHPVNAKSLNIHGIQLTAAQSDRQESSPQASDKLLWMEMPTGLYIQIRKIIVERNKSER